MKGADCHRRRRSGDVWHDGFDDAASSRAESDHRDAARLQQRAARGRRAAADAACAGERRCPDRHPNHRARRRGEDHSLRRRATARDPGRARGRAQAGLPLARHRRDRGTEHAGNAHAATVRRQRPAHGREADQQVEHVRAGGGTVRSADHPALLGDRWTTGKTTRFTLEEGGEKIVLECAMGPVQVAAATAVRARSRQSECGDRGKWQPLATKRVEALRCGIDDSPIEPMFPPDRREEMAFTAAPGIEFLFVNDDCVIQGGGYRFVPGGGGVGPIRPPGTL